MRTRAVLLLAVLALAAQLAIMAGARAEAFVPANDAVVVEQLREHPRDDELADYRRLRTQLRARPDDAALAAATARAAIGLARRDGDPRFLGAAEAALGPWWNQPDAPRPLRVLRAILRQSNHDFDAALSELDALLRVAPDEAQARLVRASVLQVQGRYDAAERDLHLLADHPQAGLYARAGLAELASLQGDAARGAAELAALMNPTSDRAARSSQAGAPPAWITLLDAEMAARRDDAAHADRAFRAALGATPDAYTLGAYADFLLDQRRPAEAARLLVEHQRADALLLRLALAWRAMNDPRWQAATAELDDRFRAARLRGNTVHRREEARFRLALKDDAGAALTLARDNWLVQREPADLRLLIDCASAAASSADTADSDAARLALAEARRFITANRLDDRRLRAALAVANPRPAT